MSNVFEEELGDMEPASTEWALRMLQQCCCRAGEPHVGSDWIEGSDHGHTACYAMGLAARKIKALERWKAEATKLISQFEKAWEAAGEPGHLGQDKSLALAEWCRRRAG